MKLSFYLRRSPLLLPINAFLITIQVASAQVVEPSFCNNQNSEGYQRIEDDGVAREYILYPPSLESSDTPTALLINFHGYGDCANDYAEAIGNFYGLNNIADVEGFLIAYPQAMIREKGDPYWEPGDVGPDIAVNDVEFARRIVSDIANTYDIDVETAFAVGFSNGGMMAYDLACTAADVFSSAAIVSGVRLDGACDDSISKSILHIHGSADMVIPLEGSGDFPSVYSSINFWVEQNQIPEGSGISSVLNGGDVTRERYVGGREGTEVNLYVINTEFDKPAGHSWFSAPIEGQTPNQLIWDFFSDSTSSSPSLEAIQVDLGTLNFREGDGDSVVLAFDLFGDIDGRLDGLSITATGELDDSRDVGLVKVYLDENNNRAADPSEFLGQSTYTEDDGVITFEFANPVFTMGGAIRILVTYEL